MKILLISIVICTLGMFTVDNIIRKDYHSERDALAAIIESECSNCSILEKYLVGSVVLNRCNHKDYPNEIHKVINQPSQFHGRKTKRYRPTRTTKKVADDLLGGLYITPEILYFCTYASKQPFDKVLVFGEKHIYGK